MLPTQGHRLNRRGQLRSCMPHGVAKKGQQPGTTHALAVMQEAGKSPIWVWEFERREEPSCPVLSPGQGQKGFITGPK